MEIDGTPFAHIMCVVGIVVCILILLFSLYLLIQTVIEYIHERKWNYIYKHRFDKSPTAKCYCKDCEMHGLSSNRCMLPGSTRYTPDNGFCYEAEPRTLAHEERRNKILSMERNYDE